MGTVGTGFSMSLDGFIARKNDEMGPLFDWMTKGQQDYVVTTGYGAIDMKLADASVEMFENAIASTGALLCGRRLFDITGAWGGRHPLNVPIVVLTHIPPQEWVEKEGSPFTFVTEGFEAALAKAKEIAGAKNVAIASTTVAQQCLNLGLMDEIHIDLVHVLLGEGKRLFDNLNISDTDLQLVAAKNAPGVTHMTFKVLKKQ
jgi:dihydrofolate reductase